MSQMQRYIETREARVTRTMVATGTILVTDTGTATRIRVTDTAMGTILVTDTATHIQITDMGTDTTRAGGIATGGGLGDATDISLRQPYGAQVQIKTTAVLSEPPLPPLSV